MTTPPATVSGRASRVTRRGQLGQRRPEQRDEHERHAQPDGVRDQQDGAARRVGAHRRQRERGREVGPDARRPADAEDGADQEGARNPAPAHPLGQAAARTDRSRSLKRTAPQDRQPEEDDHGAAHDLEGASADRALGEPAEAAGRRDRAPRRPAVKPATYSSEPASSLARNVRRRLGRRRGRPHPRRTRMPGTRAAAAPCTARRRTQALRRRWRRSAPAVSISRR